MNMPTLFALVSFIGVYTEAVCLRYSGIVVPAEASVIAEIEVLALVFVEELNSGLDYSQYDRQKSQRPQRDHFYLSKPERIEFLQNVRK